MIRFVAIMLAAFAVSSGAAKAQSDPVKRGDYLMNTIMTCANCHSPKGPPEATAGKDYSGGLSWDEAPFKVTAPNITQDKETGIGSWTDAEIKTLMRTGKRPNGVQIAEIMPTAFYGIITDSDMDAIVAYLRTIAPVSNKVPDPVYKMQIPHGSFPGAEDALYRRDAQGHGEEGPLPSPPSATAWSATRRWGPRGKDYAGKMGIGGFEFPGPWGVSVSKNITTSKTKGIGEWTDDQIRQAVTKGVSKDGNPLKPPMGFQYYAHMTADDLDAVVAYLRTVPPNE